MDEVKVPSAHPAKSTCRVVELKWQARVVAASSSSNIDTAVGIDLGANDLWIIGLSDSPLPRVSFAKHLPASDLGSLSLLLNGASAVAIDAPESLSAGSHIGDTRLARKFQRARCSEVALRRRGIAVPFATPLSGEPVPTWMLMGFAAWQVAKDAAPRVVETFPHGIFWQLAGRPLLHKQRPEGRAARRDVLARVIEIPVGVDYWPHDALDAMACAYVAWRLARGEAERVSCVDDADWATHDGSEMWLGGEPTETVGVARRSGAK